MSLQCLKQKKQWKNPMLDKGSKFNLGESKYLTWFKKIEFKSTKKQQYEKISEGKFCPSYIFIEW